MITDRDIAVRGVAEGKSPNTPLRDVMTTDVKYCFDDQDIEEVTLNMGDIQVRRPPVVDPTNARGHPFAWGRCRCRRKWIGRRSVEQAIASGRRAQPDRLNSGADSRSRS
jgi:CBS domain-containing protein